MAAVDRVRKELIYGFSLIVVFLEFGGVFSFGAAFVALLEKYQKDRSTTAAVQSIMIGVTSSCGVVSGALISKLGLPFVLLISCILVPAGFCSSFFATRIEHLYVSIGIVLGIGISMGYISLVVVVGRMFTGQKRSLYLSIQSAFVSLSGLIYPYILEWLIGLYGLNETFLLLGALYCNKIPFLILCACNRTSLTSKTASAYNNNTCVRTENSPAKPKKNIIVDRVRKFKQILSKTFLLLIIAVGVSVPGIIGFTGLVLDLSLWKGFTTSQGLFTFVILNITNTLSRLFPGFLKQIKNVDSLIYPIIAAVSGIIGQVIIFLGNSYSFYMLGIGLTGLCLGGIVSSMMLVILEIVRQEYIPVAIGLVFTVTGITSVSTGPIFGSIMDIFGSYEIVILTVAALQGIAAIFFFIALIFRRIYTIKKKKIQQNRRSTVFAVTVSKL